MTKVYYMDDHIWVIGHTERTLLGISWELGRGKSKYQQYRDTHILSCVYVRIEPNVFKALKERDPYNSRLVDVMRTYDIHLTYDSDSMLRFAEPKDEFLFNLKFGSYESR